MPHSSPHDRDLLAPAQPPGRLRSVALAVLVHALLIGALTWGVNWKSSADDEPAAQAELWAAIPQQAAPREVLPPAPPPPPPPVPEPAAAPPEPRPVAPPPPPTPRAAAPDTHDADIALEQKKR